MTDEVPSSSRPAGRGRREKPTIVLFDVNETLSDMSPMADRFEEVGASAAVARTWFAGVLRDGFALAAVGASSSFAQIATQNLLVTLHGMPLNRATEEAVDHIMSGFRGLEVHRDVPEGIRALSSHGVRLATLSNGSISIADALLERAGIRHAFERLLTVEDAGIWKPAPGAYNHALDQCGVEPARAMLVAVHPWDVDGAGRAGLATAWIDRTGSPYPRQFRAPDLRCESISDLADQLR